MNHLLIVVCSLGCGAVAAVAQARPKLTVSSTAFADGAAIPAKYTCEGDDLSPPLQWDGAPASTKSFALICDDPDAPGRTWVHWVLYNVPSTTSALAEGTPKTGSLPGGGAQGLNSFGKTGYGGPCPPAGKAHRYFFKVYALDAVLSMEGQPKKEDLLKAMEGHSVASGQLLGKYQRR